MNTFDIIISDQLRAILEVIESQSQVAQLLLRKRHYGENIVEDPINYLSISASDPSKISYLTLDRYESLSDSEDIWLSKKRYHVKPGALVGKIFKDISLKEIELFSNLFRTESCKEKFELKVIKGEDIRTYYNYRYYNSESGTLGVSCMKHDGCRAFFDIYVENPDVISMLIMLNSSNRLIGRALLWDFGSYKLMDRIYTSDDERLPFHFKKWATEHSYLYKSEQNWYNTMYFENMNTAKKSMKIELNLKNRFFDLYPYLDTFKFYNIETGTLYNYIPSDNDYIVTLCATNGGKYERNYLRLDDVDDVYRYRPETYHLPYRNIYTSERNIVWSEVNDSYILKTDSIYVDDIMDNIFAGEWDNLNNLERIEARRKNIEMYKNIKIDSIEQCVHDMLNTTLCSDSGNQESIEDMGYRYARFSHPFNFNPIEPQIINFDWGSDVTQLPDS